MGTSSIVLILSLVFISLLVACTILLVVFWIKKRKNNNNTKAHSSLKHKHQISNMFANSKYLGETNNEDLKKIYQLIDNHQNILIVGTNIETITLKLQNIIYQYKKFYKKRIVILSATKTSITNLDSVSIDKFIGINENNIKYQTIIKSKT
jgi:hypothetical protein